MKNEASKLIKPSNSVNPVISGSLRIAAQKLLDAVGKHHPQMAMDTQLDLYMAYHEVKEALNNDLYNGGI